MTTPFAQFNSYGGYIGRCPVNVRLWGKGPFLLQGWGAAK